MQINLDMPPDLEVQLKAMVFKSTQEALEEFKSNLVNKEWFSLKEAREYAGVSNATFNKFRVMGLKVATIDNVHRVSRKEVDRFLNNFSY
ncbi:DNA-binding protein [Kurthia gibsonii]|uniref:DNA-binding protein n=1 Tax=Kurthia gibsonii TaxID=33946 RepID=UPI0030D05804